MRITDKILPFFSSMPDTTDEENVLLQAPQEHGKIPPCPQVWIGWTTGTLP
jgi:hypothetical protein